MTLPLHQLDRQSLLRLLDLSLLRQPSDLADPPAIYAGLGRRMSAELLPLLPAPTQRAAVLVPLVDRDDGFHVLLTQRSAQLKNHAGQISFPGGRIETGDRDARTAALRETAEEIGLAAPLVRVLGYLPDHVVISGFRVTPVVGLVTPPLELSIDRSEVDEAFEVPLNYLLDPAHHRPRRRQLQDREIELTDMPYGARNIWGATAGMLMTLFSLLAEARKP
jgi:8-oxo-dGTP pyrophosphatase MutT (NUDIX family)